MHSSYRIVSQAAQALDIRLPTDLVEAVAAAETIASTIDAIGASPDRLHRSILDCVSAGKDYTSDRTVQKLAFEHLAMTHGLALAATQRRDRDIEAALAGSADELLAAMSEVLVPHSESLTAAVQADVADLDDATRFATNVALLQIWDAARTARQMFDHAVKTTMALLFVSHVNTDVRDARTLTFSEANIDVFDAVRRTGQHLSPWTVTQEGGVAAVPQSLAAYADRVADLAAQRQAAAVEPEYQRPAYSTWS